MFGKLIARTDEARAIQATAFGSWGSEGQPTWSGANVTPEESVRLLTVYGATRFIADGIATLPVDTFRTVGDESIPLKNPSIVEQPTVDLDRVAWMGQVLTSLLLDGNAYCLRIYEGSMPTGLVPVNPSVCQVGRVDGRKTIFINGVPATSADVLHIPGLMWPGSDVGMSPVEMARQSIGLGIAAQEHGARFFGQGASLSGVIEVPGELPPDKAKELANAWARRHSGKSRAHLPGVLEGGAKWEATGVTNEQAQFLETRRFTAAEIAAQMFLVDPSELGIGVEGTSLTYANIEQRGIRRVQVTYLPWIVRIEHALSGVLANPRFVKLNVNGLLRGDAKTRYESYAVGIRNDFLLRSEARDFEDFPPIDGIDDRPLPAATAPAATPAQEK